MNKDDMSEDAEFEAFLKGEGELARRLQALPQSVPGAALDAAILAQAKLSAAQPEVQAANDPGSAVAAPRLAPLLGRRWTIPAGIAASVLAGVLGHQAFKAGESSEPVAIAVAEVAAPVAEMAPHAPQAAPAPVALQGPVPAAAAKSSRARANPKAGPPRGTPAPVEGRYGLLAADPGPAASDAEASDARLPALARSYQAQRAKSIAPASPAPQAPAPAAPQEEQASPPPGDAPAEAGAWLSRIEAMLEQEQVAEAQAEWHKFRTAHPDYPLPDAVREKIDALKH